MKDGKKLNRRGFLKLSIAAATAAGLSHFRFLNIGGVKRAFANGCGEEPDQCIPLQEVTDYCDPTIFETDVCAEFVGEEDFCDPGNYPTEPDYACPTDTCVPGNADLDFCAPEADPDECDAIDVEDYDCDVVGEDTCDVTDPDLCNPWAYEPDVCDASSVDEPTAVDVESFSAKSEAQSKSWTSAVLGGMAAALSLLIAKFRSTSREDSGNNQ